MPLQQLLLLLLLLRPVFMAVLPLLPRIDVRVVLEDVGDGRGGAQLGRRVAAVTLGLIDVVRGGGTGEEEAGVLKTSSLSLFSSLGLVSWTGTLTGREQREKKRGGGSEAKNRKFHKTATKTVCALKNKKRERGRR